MAWWLGDQPSLPLRPSSFGITELLTHPIASEFRPGGPSPPLQASHAGLVGVSRFRGVLHGATPENEAPARSDRPLWQHRPATADSQLRTALPELPSRPRRGPVPPLEKPLWTPASLPCSTGSQRLAPAPPVCTKPSNSLTLPFPEVNNCKRDASRRLPRLLSVSCALLPECQHFRSQASGRRTATPQGPGPAGCATLRSSVQVRTL